MFDRGVARLEVGGVERGSFVVGAWDTQLAVEDDLGRVAQMTFEASEPSRPFGDDVRDVKRR
jgi:hypothetical protein